MIEIKPEFYYYGQWFAHGFLPNTDQEVDWMAMIYKEGAKDDATKPWQLKYRFRYYDKYHTDPFDHADKKNWYSATAPGDRDIKELVSGSDEILKFMADSWRDSDSTFVLFDCMGDLAVFKLMGEEHSHVKVMTQEQAKEAGYLDSKGEQTDV